MPMTAVSDRPALSWVFQGRLSTGEAVKSPEYAKIDRKIRRFQRQMARQVKSSNRRARTRLKIAKLKATIKDIRQDFFAQAIDSASQRESSCLPRRS